MSSSSEALYLVQEKLKKRPTCNFDDFSKISVGFACFFDCSLSIFFFFKQDCLSSSLLILNWYSLFALLISSWFFIVALNWLPCHLIQDQCLTLGMNNLICIPMLSVLTGVKLMESKSHRFFLNVILEEK